MGKPNGNAALFALRLRREIDARNLSVRAFGKMTDPDHPERGRRRVQRHLSGNFLPSPASRIAYARALGLPEEFFLDEDDEDLSAPLTRGVRDVHREVRQLRAEVRALSTRGEVA